MSPIARPRAKAAAQSGSPQGPTERLLQTAFKLFAAQGIRSVGIDQILREAGVAKASMYSSYGSKEALVLAYLNELDHRDRNRWADAVTGLHDAVAKVLTFFDLAIDAARARDFRGCLYANAATEFPGVELEPVRAHREWLRRTLADLLATAGLTDPSGAADEIQLLYDGALVSSKLQRTVAPIELARRLAYQRIAAPRPSAL